MKKIAGLLVFIFLLIMVEAQNFTIPLWEGDIPNLREADEIENADTTDIVRISKVQRPTISVFLPSKKNTNGQAVVICPGGGYVRLAYDWEGTDIAKWLNSKGIAAIVLKYRLPGTASSTVGHRSPLLDAQRAMRMVRLHAAEWNIDSRKIGIMGFSAGGHLASTLGTHFDEGISESADAVDRTSCRPDFMILMYPVISMDSVITHKGSMYSLLGKNPGDELINLYSNELQVTENTPPVFIVHSIDDKAVPVENSLRFMKSLKEKGISCEMHLYPTGGHGYSLALGDHHLSTWPDRCIDWLKWIDNR
ncbi:MAG: alpha/beta hydrolase [Bacteroidales bacterium]|nr:alpha/beta hydrolase [Bacteroidales bacterium]